MGLSGRDCRMAESIDSCGVVTNSLLLLTQDEVAIAITSIRKKLRACLLSLDITSFWNVERELNPLRVPQNR